jgi:hypothetical protein
MAWLALVAAAGCAVAASPAAGFTLYGPSEDPAAAARWTEPTLSGGIRVGVDASFLDAWGATTSDPAVIEGWLERALSAWESPVLRFEIQLGSLVGAELQLFALPGADPLGGYYGIGQAFWSYDPDRVLTNGQAVPGWAITHARIDIAAEKLQTVPGFSTLGLALQSRILVRLLMHEIGHTIGLHHPLDSALVNWDTDHDPANPMEIDPADPFANLVHSDERFGEAIMSNQPCPDGQPICQAIVSNQLTPDDIGGRDVLYPALAPEPGGLAALGVAGALAAARRRRLR